MRIYLGSFQGERVGTTFPLLKCLRMQYGRNCELFSTQKCTGLQYFAYTISKFFQGDSDTPGPPQMRPGARTQTPILAYSPAFPLFLLVPKTSWDIVRQFLIICRLYLLFIILILIIIISIL